MKSNKEAAKEGKAEVNVTQIVPSTPAVQDETNVPEYNLSFLQRMYNDGHLFKIKYVDKDPLGGGVSTEVYPVDGLQQLFACSRSLDLDGDGRFSFGEYMNIKRNFKKGEPLEACVVIGGSAMKVTKVEKKLRPDEFETVSVTAKVNLKLLDENYLIINEKSKEFVFSGYHQKVVFREKIDTSELKPGFYILQANYSDNFDTSIDKTPGMGIFDVNRNRRDLMLTSLNQFFQLH